MRPRLITALALFTCVAGFAAEYALPIRARSHVSLTTPGPSSTHSTRPIGKPIDIPAPLGLPPVPIPPDNPPTAETVALGRRLFFDKILSRDRSLSCASCHDPKHGMADPNPNSNGYRDQKGNRNAPTVLNAAYASPLFWDGRAPTLEKQAEGPVENSIELAHSLLGVVRRLMSDPTYIAQFAKAWGPGPITFETVEKSIASYERTLVSGNSPFDRYYFGGDKTAMNASAIRGLQLFLDPSLRAANCISCHRIDDTHATFTEARFHNTGVAFDPATGKIKDPGRAAINGDGRLNGGFRTVTLRNIALTAPYMHDGSMKTLEEVVDFYFEGGRTNNAISNDMPQPGLPGIPKDQQPQAKKDLVEFMKALTGDMPPGANPPQ
ncbi:MAG: cytochrome c peroxidase [Acidobacteriota bacterium]